MRLGKLTVRDRLSDMPETPPCHKEITIADLFPELSPGEQDEVREALDEYCELLFQIFERQERARLEVAFDESAGNSYDDVKVDSLKQITK